MNMITAYTAELDDTEAAVSEIVNGLNLEKNLKKNSVGLLSCDCEFVELGIVKALQQALPFDLIGITTIGCSSAYGKGPEGLSLSVLTSDTARIDAAITPPFTTGDVQDVLRSSFLTATNTIDYAPDLILIYSPLYVTMGGAPIFEALGRRVGSAPIFGAIACDPSIDFSKNKIIYKGEGSHDRAVGILIKGISPEFCTVSASVNPLQKVAGVITASDGPILKEVNGFPFIDYLTSIGMPSLNLRFASSVPFMVTPKGERTPIATALHSITADGHGAFGLPIPIGASIAVGHLNEDVVIRGANQIAAAIKKTGRKNALIYSCMSRNVVLGRKGRAETDAIAQALGGGISYQIAYVGGEMCPAALPTGIKNRYLNFSCIACAF